MENESEIMTPDAAEIRNRIYTIRGKQVMLDSDLAELYGYEVKNLNRQVKRNIRRFPKSIDTGRDGNFAVPKCHRKC